MLALPASAHPDKTLQVGDSDVYEFDGMTTAAVGSPAVADIVPLSAHRLLVNAKGVGETTLFVYDRRGKHRLILAVVPPAPDLGPLASQVQADIGLPGVTARAVKDTVFLGGNRHHRGRPSARLRHRRCVCAEVSKPSPGCSGQR